jgi:hypothetical protein
LPAFAFAVRVAEQTPVDAIRNTENRDKAKGLSWRFINAIARFLMRAGSWRTEGMCMKAGRSKGVGGSRHTS